jgi:hypothetical protein
MAAEPRFAESIKGCRGVPPRHLAQEVEAEWRETDPAAYAQHLFRRVRGRDEPDDVADLMAETNEGMTALFLDIRNSTVSRAATTRPRSC